MRKLIALFAVTFSVCGYCDVESQTVNNYHRIYIEPDYSWNVERTYEVENYLHVEKGQYYGLNAGYEFLKPNDFYAGIEGSASLGNQVIGIYVDNYPQFKSIAYKNRVEGRFGYCLKANHFSLTPFSGGGGYFLVQGRHYSNFAYIPIGIKAEYQMNQLSLGIKTEQMHFVYYWNSYFEKKSYSVWKSGLYGYEVSLPIVFKSETPGGKWHSAVEPYYLKMYNDIIFVGGRFSVMHEF
ncbi:MAG: hypothetical protein COT85_07860 [Chlamydiae bacterium CG10_big_fil_rev_8_21_14_0_10_42_34]|nr:MAG: hypothetical protein COT85_07860 [Chlamydiae bacterium CG10_big_fil_rev_8_21_14_0_10_42_34]